MGQNIVKAYDVRGIFPEEINGEVVARIGKALGRHFRVTSEKRQETRNATIVVGRDARTSAPELYGALTNALRVAGTTLVEAGLITTPMLYFLVNDLDTDGGVMITASHNPKDYNGLKIVGRYAAPIGGEEIRALLDTDIF